MNSVVNFETSKLLKEKGFKEGSRKGYLENGELGISHYSGLCWNDDEDYPTKYSAPTITQVVMWLYEKHKIWISVCYKQSKFIISFQMKDINIIKGICGDDGIEYNKVEYYKSPTEAYNDAIIYALKKLI